MKKKITSAKPLKKGKKDVKSITTTSIAFKTKNIEGLKAHDLHIKEDQSISSIVNKLVKKFLAGEVALG